MGLPAGLGIDVYAEGGSDGAEGGSDGAESVSDGGRKKAPGPRGSRAITEDGNEISSESRHPPLEKQSNGTRGAAEPIPAQRGEAGGKATIRCAVRPSSAADR